MLRFISFFCYSFLFCLLLSCKSTENKPVEEKPSAASAQTFLASAEQELSDALLYYNHASWLAATYINIDSQFVEAQAAKNFSLKTVQFANQAARWDGVTLPAVEARKLSLLKRAVYMPPPNDDQLADELAQISSELQAMYGAGTYCRQDDECLDLGQMSELMASSRDPEFIKELWVGWRSISPPMRAMYQQQVQIANQGARDLGFKDLSELWRAGYDMSPTEFASDVDAQWDKVKPLYEALHCYVRGELNQVYGDAVVPDQGLIPAHLLGNMWAQQWGNIYPLVAPKDSARPYDLTQIINDKNLSEIDMVKIGEQFFSSLGFEPLPETFWQRSLFTKPRDRDVVCHASAWDIDDQDDLRIKMCIQKTAEDFTTIHHELGHNYYQRAYKDQPLLFRGSANDGFHEALGDTIVLSITPEYLNKIGFLDQLPDPSSDIGFLLSQALDRIAFLPFGLLVDKWRWQVFSGEVSAEQYNQSWWALRERYQGLAAPVARSESDFDPGAKYHIPGNTPYTRYFLAFIQQFQFHRALCETANFKGPLHRCSIYGNKDAGDKLKKMMEMGASKPWQDAMQVMTGQRDLDASAIAEYFAPLKTWLDQKNQDRQCGW